MFKVNDLVSRISYNHDVIFKIKEIKENEVLLEGYDKRLIATAFLSDIVLVNETQIKSLEESATNRLKSIKKLSRNKMHMTGKILHIDADKIYLDKCLKLYEELNLPAFGVYMDEVDTKKIHS